MPALRFRRQNPAVLYAGGNVLFKSEDRGHTWKPISPDLTLNDKSKQQSSGGPVVKDNSGAEVYDAILRITPSTKDPNVIWVGTDDGQVQLTRDGGATWTNVTAHIPGLPPWGRVESIDLAADNAGEARDHGGSALQRRLQAVPVIAPAITARRGNPIAGDLPQVYAHVAHRDLHNPHMYYAGLENGLYVTWDDGGTLVSVRARPAECFGLRPGASRSATTIWSWRRTDARCGYSMT